MTAKKTLPPPEPPTFNEALAELEEILARIEGEEIDIDRLAAELRRASVLLELCRGKLRKAEVEVTQIVQGLEEGEAGEGDREEDLDAEP
jgi:exodeoxyribonuclease VII small subunit